MELDLLRTLIDFGVIAGGGVAAWFVLRSQINKDVSAEEQRLIDLRGTRIEDLEKKIKELEEKLEDVRSELQGVKQVQVEKIISGILTGLSKDRLP